MNRVVMIVCLIGFFGWTGCGDAEQTTADEQPSGQGWSFETDAGGEPTLAQTCQASSEPLEPVWIQEQPSFWYQPSFFGFSPNAGLLIRGDVMLSRTDAFRVSDGEYFHADLGSYVHAVDKDWRLLARSQAYTRNIDIVERTTGEVLRTLDLEHEHEHEHAWLGAAAFSPTSDTLTTITCSQDTMYASTWKVGSGERLLHTELRPKQGCWQYSAPSPHLAYTPDGSAVVASLPETGHIAYVDIERGQLQTVRAHQPHRSEETMLPEESILGLAMHPGGELVATSGARGGVRLWSLPELEQVGETLPAGVTGININTYAVPHRVSPVAWSPDGSLLATVSKDGNVVLREPGGDIVDTLLMPTPEPEFTAHTTSGVANPPMAIAFDAAGRIAVGGYVSTAMWQCGDDVTPRGDGELAAELSLEGPTELQVSEAAIFSVQMDTLEQPVVVRMLVDGVQHVWPQSLARWVWQWLEPGTYQLRVEVDDGYASKSTEMTVVVTDDEEEGGQ